MKFNKCVFIQTMCALNLLLAECPGFQKRLLQEEEESKLDDWTVLAEHNSVFLNGNNVVIRLNP